MRASPDPGLAKSANASVILPKKQAAVNRKPGKFADFFSFFRRRAAFYGQRRRALAQGQPLAQRHMLSAHAKPVHSRRRGNPAHLRKKEMQRPRPIRRHRGEKNTPVQSRRTAVSDSAMQITGKRQLARPPFYAKNRRAACHRAVRRSAFFIWFPLGRSPSNRPALRGCPPNWRFR